MNSSDTMFAPAEREDQKSVMEDADSLSQNGIAQQVVHVIPTLLLILNNKRQIVFRNRRLSNLLGDPPDKEILGKRPGELFNCIHSNEHDGGCGTAEACRECGAVRAVLESQKTDSKVEKECRITTAKGEAFEFNVWAAPYKFEGHDYTIVSLVDIGHEKRREALERTFFHDVNNLLMPILGFSEIMKSANLPETIAHSVDMLSMASKELLDEITSHRKLLQAEHGELMLELTAKINSVSLLNDLLKLVNESWPDKTTILNSGHEEFHFSSDRTLLFRVLYNMIKNAVEASSTEDKITVNSYKEGSNGVFSVNSKKIMTRPVQLQIFQRSFSTKGVGRGIGTYSMKLFGERYLKGKVWFSVKEAEGTTFFISIPLQLEND